MRLAAIVAASLLASAGCSPQRDSRSASAAPAAPVSPKTVALGERITAPLVPLTDIAREPGRYRDQTVATSGKVTAVCQEMGCWLEIADASGQAHVKLHGHSFFVPRTAPGHVARIQGKVVLAHGEAAAGADDCEAQVSSADGGLAKVAFDATGVEID